MSARDIAEAATALRRAVNKGSDDTESDSDHMEIVTNRGNKLRKRAKYVHEGQLAPKRDLLLHRETIIYGDSRHSRDIISHVPRLYDQDGYRLDSDEDDEERIDIAQADAAEAYPYADVHIENLLAPLTSAGDLARHPTLAKPFTSPILSQLTTNACTMLHKERASLWSMKHLLTKMGGDHIWCPTEMMEGDDDLALFPDNRKAFRDHLYTKETIIRDEQMQEMKDIAEELEEQMIDAPAQKSLPGSPSVQKETTAKENDEVAPVVETSEQTGEDLTMLDVPVRTPVIARMSSPVAPVFSPISPIQIVEPSTQPAGEVMGAEAQDKIEPENDPDETLVDDSTILEDDQEQVDVVNGHESLPDEPGQGDSGDNAPSPRRMRTRAQMAATDSNRSSSQESEAELIDPYFLPPASSIPSQLLGLPREEAVEVKRILQLYIQKQEEVVRASERIYNNLLKADRLRKEVYGWAKAEAHVGEMSDGEDWYDPDDWDLSMNELRKGEDEVEEQEVGEGKGAKKTRARRQ